MSTTYKVSLGDTFETISIKNYGSEVHSGLIKKANPGVIEPLIQDIFIIIPELVGVPKDLSSQANSGNVNEVSVLIDGLRFKFWDTLRIIKSIDSIDIVQFRSPYDINNVNLVKLFKPFRYKKLEVYVGPEKFFTGVLVSVNPKLQNEQNDVSISCYSSPGVLDDCTPPASSFPLEFSFLNLKDIAIALCEPFGIKVIFIDDFGSPFDIVSMDIGIHILAFLTELAQQRNLVISSDEFGNLIFWRSITQGQSKAILRQGHSPLLSIDSFFNEQEYYSHITGVEHVFVGIGGSLFTVKNSRIQGVLRPFTFSINDIFGADIQETVESKSSRMFSNTISYSVTVSTWRGPDAQIWKPNTLITIFAPGVMIVKDYQFNIRNVQFMRTNDSETAILNLVIPQSFNGEIPEDLPWDD